MREIPAELVVIGAGPAGLAAAVAAARAGLREIYLLDRLEEPGGILQQCIHNGFGLRYFKEELTGPEYAERFIGLARAEEGIHFLMETMAVGLTADRRVLAMNPRLGFVSFAAKAVVLAMGCRERTRGAINIPGTRPAGIFTAGCLQRLMNIDGYLPGRRAVILGSGDIGLIMARRLTLEGIKVLAVLELMPYTSGLTRNVVQCLEDFGIPLRLGQTVIEVLGRDRVEGIVAAPVDGELRPIRESAYTIGCDTLVLSVGLIPENEISLQAGVELDPATAGPRVDPHYMTSVPGIFACGNVAHVHDLVDDVSLEAALAGGAAARYALGRHTPAACLEVSAGRNIRSVVPQKVALDRPTTLYIRVSRPERDVFLRVGRRRRRERIVTPGEMLRYTVEPELVAGGDERLDVSIEARKSGESVA
ncbi:MAG: NAD(P)/FAD-dependent oxidoreductase [Patescibacteria group bacterium]